LYLLRLYLLFSIKCNLHKILLGRFWKLFCLNVRPPCWLPTPHPQFLTTPKSPCAAARPVKWYLPKDLYLSLFCMYYYVHKYVCRHPDYQCYRFRMLCREKEKRRHDFALLCLCLFIFRFFDKLLIFFCFFYYFILFRIRGRLIPCPRVHCRSVRSFY
jgi:hypothetical protein